MLAVKGALKRIIVVRFPTYGAVKSQGVIVILYVHTGR